MLSAKIHGSETMINHVYPNCLAFDHNGRMFVGDS